MRLKAAREKKFIVTKKLLECQARVQCQVQYNTDVPNLRYWYLSFCKINRVTVRRLTGLRRKKYTPQQVK